MAKSSALPEPYEGANINTGQGQVTGRQNKRSGPSDLLCGEGSFVNLGCHPLERDSSFYFTDENFSVTLSPLSNIV